MRTVVVTGDSSGLGNVISRVLLERGYKVVGISRRETDEVKTLRQEFGVNYIHIKFNLEETENIRGLYLDHIKPNGPIYGLVNNAAFAYDDIVTNANLEMLNRMYKINVMSPIMLTKYIIRDMLLNAVQGSIVHISSVSAHTGYKGLSMYASTKGALESFSKGVAREWGAKGIRSNCVAPGFMETPMSGSLSKEQKMRIYKRTSLKKATNIDTVAKTVAFLISEESESITGTVVNVDCGTI